MALIQAIKGDFMARSWPVRRSADAPLTALAGRVREARFWLIAARRGWATAMALAGDGLDPDLRAWCWLKLNCYGFALEAVAGRAPRRLEGAIARAASLAALGDVDGAEMLLRGWLARRAPGRRGRRLMRATLAPFLPRPLLEACGPETPPAMRAALLDMLRDRRAARAALEATDHRARRHPDAPLVAANCGMIGPLEALNRRFDADGLAMVSCDGPPGPGNLRADPVALSTVAGPRDGPLVTVIMAAYRTGGRIRPAIDSLRAQTYRAIEIIVVDDASDDDTAAVVAALASADPRVRLLRQTCNAGPYAARAAALRVARGAFVTVHDSDDWAHPERVARQVAPLMRRERLVATTSAWVRMDDENGRFYARQGWPLSRLNPASPMFRRAALARIGGFDQVRAGADSEFLQRLTLAFGASAVRRSSRLLSVGAHRAGSLMTDPAIGATGGAPSASRLAYWQAWRRWHIQEVAAGRAPRLPMRGRAFPAPATLLDPDAPGDVALAADHGPHTAVTVSENVDEDCRANDVDVGHEIPVTPASSALRRDDRGRS